MFYSKFTILFIVWVIVLLAGLRQVTRYDSVPGISAHPQKSWPSASGIHFIRGNYNLVLAAHPQCPCTRASLEELAQLLSHFPKKLNACVLFYKPHGFEDGWEKTGFWKSASLTPGIQVMTDVDGKKATLFDATTSGQVVLYDPNGHLVFSGGITSSQGHIGANNGSEAIAALINGEHTSYRNTPVFGCSLGNSTTRIFKK